MLVMTPQQKNLQLCVWEVKEDDGKMRALILLMCLLLCGCTEKAQIGEKEIMTHLQENIEQYEEIRDTFFNHSDEYVLVSISMDKAGEYEGYSETCDDINDLYKFSEIQRFMESTGCDWLSYSESNSRLTLMFSNCDPPNSGLYYAPDGQPDMYCKAVEQCDNWYYWDYPPV